MSDQHFWLSDSQFESLKPLLPNKVRGVPRVDDRKVISGIIHVIRNGCRWRDAPGVYGPHKTLYNRFVRWSKAGVFEAVFKSLAASGKDKEVVMIDSTHLKAHRTSASLLKKGALPAYRPQPGRADLQATRGLRRQRPANPTAFDRRPGQRPQRSGGCFG